MRGHKPAGKRYDEEGGRGRRRGWLDDGGWMIYTVEISNGTNTEIEQCQDEYEAATYFAQCLQDILVDTSAPFHLSGTVISIHKDGDTILEYTLPLD